MGVSGDPEPPPYTPDVGLPVAAQAPMAQAGGLQREISLPDVLDHTSFGGRSVTQLEREDYLKRAQLPQGIQEEILVSLCCRYSEHTTGGLHPITPPRCTFRIPTTYAHVLTFAAEPSNQV